MEARSADEVFADWWNQSEMWVCRWCGWCSDPTDALHRREGALSAEIFSFVMAQTVVAEEEKKGSSWTEGRVRVEEDRHNGMQALGEADSRRLRSAIEDMLRVSVGMLGRRHWATYCCLLLRLELDMVLLESATPSLQKTTAVGLDRATRDLNGLWQWLELAPVTLPPEYYIFNVVCVMAVQGLGHARGRWGAARELLMRVDTWASAFAGSQERMKLERSHAAVRWHLRNHTAHCS